MAIKTITELMDSMRTVLGENTSDEALALFDDVQDTFSSIDNKDWKTRYEQNDAAWRKKYRDRFFSGNSNDDDDKPQQEEQPKNTFESLFKEMI